MNKICNTKWVLILTIDVGWYLDFPAGLVGQGISSWQCRRCRRRGFNPCVRKTLWKRKWQPTPVFCLGNPLDRGAWRPTDHGVAQSQTWLSDWAHTQVSIQAHWLYKANVPSVQEWWWLGKAVNVSGQRIYEKFLYFLFDFAVNLKLLKRIMN